MTDYEAIVIGGGIAALTAGLFLSRLGRSTLVLEPAIPGGQIVSVPAIEDFPGFAGGVSGYELGPNTQMQAMQAGAEFRMAEAQALTFLDGAWLVTTSDGEIRARSVIVASGSRPRLLNAPGEARLHNQGVIHCASCNAPLYRGKTVGVVGGGDAALSEALILAEHVARVLVFHRHDRFTAQHAYVRRAREHPGIEIHPHTEVADVLGDDDVSGVRVRNTLTGEFAEMPLSGLFVYIGTVPNTGFLGEVIPLAGEERIPTDISMRTERPGLFAAGDVRRDSAAQAVTAAGDGATAAFAAHRFLDDGIWPIGSGATVFAAAGASHGGD